MLKNFLKNNKNHLSKLKYSPLVLFIVTLFWFLVRVIPKPSRVIYPCQQANIAYMGTYLTALFGGGIFAVIISFWKKSISFIKNNKVKIVISILICIFSVTSYKIHSAYQEKQFRQKWSRTIPASDVNKGVVAGINTSNSVVSVRKKNISYSAAINKNTPSYNLVWQAVEDLGLGSHKNPLNDLIDNGDKVLIKINMVTSANGAYTEPAVIRPLVEMVVQAGANHIQIGDGGVGMDNCRRTMVCFEKTGYTGFVNGLKNIYSGITIELVDFNDKNKWQWINLNSKSSFAGSGFTDADLGSPDLSKSLADTDYYKTADKYGNNPNGQTMGWYAISDYILDADVIINVPKLKVHSQMILTNAIKNHVGSTIEDTRTGYYNGAGWSGGLRITHSKFGVSGNELYFENEFFWRAILDMNKIVLYADEQGNLQSTKQRKYLNVIDGIEAVQGPDNNAGKWDNHGGPNDKMRVDFGTVLAGTDPVAVDAVASRLIGYNFRDIPHVQKAITETSYKVGNNSPDNIVVVGNEISNNFNNVFEFYNNTNGAWGKYANLANLEITDFSPPQISNAQKQTSGSSVNITAVINNGVSAFVKYDLNNQQNIKKMQKSGNKYLVSIAANSSNIEVLAQDEYFNTSSSQASDGGSDPNGCILKQELDVPAQVLPGSSSLECMEVESMVLNNNTEYKIKAEGTYHYWYPAHPNALADAEWSETTDHGKPGWNKGETEYASGNSINFSSAANHDLSIDGQNIDWGQYKADHIYTIDKTGAGSKLKFKIWGSYCLDDIGSLKVSIYECDNGITPPPPPPSGDCGDGTCDRNNGETISNCPADCPRTQSKGLFNPPYPRVGQMYFYSTFRAKDIWKNHGMLIIRYNSASTASALKSKRPDIRYI